MPSLPLVVELQPVPGVLAALRAVSCWPGVILFDSPLLRENLGRYSFLAADPWSSETLPRASYGSDPFATLRHQLEPVPLVPGLPPFQGGAAGLLGFDLGQAWERLPCAPRDEFELPDMAVGLYDWVIAWDHVEGRAWVISQGFSADPDPGLRVRNAQKRMEAVLEALAGLNEPTKSNKATVPDFNRGKPLPPEAVAPSWPAPGPSGVLSNFSRESYLQAVARAIEYIHAGDIFQVNLSQRLLYPFEGSPLELYTRLRERNPATFAGYFSHTDWTIVSASPERFVCLRDGEVEARPIKGTRRRPAGPEADLFTRDVLRESEKDQAENVMIVDLLRNDLSRVCQPGTIRVPQLCHVESYATVQHLVSEIRGRLKPGVSVWDLFSAVFPGGSITGAPKVRALEIIAELEPTVRGPYCGSLFYVSHGGTMDSSILIRTFTARRGWIQFPVGGGIVAQSNPEAEYQETLDKAAGMLRALT